MKEDTKRVLVRVVAWAGWLFTLVFAYLRATGTLGQEYGIFAVMAVGASVVAGLTASRYRLQDTIVAALKTGYELSARQHEDSQRQHKDSRDRMDAMDERERPR